MKLVDVFQRSWQRRAKPYCSHSVVGKRGRSRPRLTFADRHNYALLTLHHGARSQCLRRHANLALTISRLAEAAGVQVSTIRYYERRGLVRPNARRSSGYREYDDESVRRVQFIRHAQALGFTLAEVAGLLRLRIAPGVDCSAVHARASAKLANVKARLAELERVRDARC